MEFEGLYRYIKVGHVSLLDGGVSGSRSVWGIFVAHWSRGVNKHLHSPPGSFPPFCDSVVSLDRHTQIVVCPRTYCLVVFTFHYPLFHPPPSVILLQPLPHPIPLLSFLEEVEVRKSGLQFPPLLPSHYPVYQGSNAPAW